MSKKAKVLVVDDEERNLRLMEAMLIPLGHEVLMASNGLEAIDMAVSQDPDLILLDIMMPKMDGFQVVQRLKELQEQRSIPIVMVTALKDVEDRVRALEVGADDFLSKPVDKTELTARVKSLIKVKAYHDHLIHYQKQLEEEVAERTRQLEGAFKKIKITSIETILRLSKAAEYKDEDTGSHIHRMSNYTAVVARRMGLSEKTIESVLYASPMHDVGKIGIPDRILLKPGKLEKDEWEIMKLHTLFGGRILEGGTGFIQLAKVIALTHHEKWDGSGYPNGLIGNKIPLAGRIVAIADVFDALTSKRPYKEAFSVEKSLDIIRENRGTHFDPTVVDAFFDVIDQVLEIKDTFKDEDESLLVRLAEGESSHADA